MREKEKEKVITLEDRIPKLKEQRRQKANRRSVIYISIFFFLVLVMVYLFSPLGHLGKITVSGNHFVDKKTILSASGLSKKSSFWDVHPDAVKHKIKKNVKEIKTVTLKKHFPNAVSIHVTEYGRVAYLKKNGHYYPILQNGLLLTALKRKDIPVNAPILVNWPKGKHLANMAAQLKKLPGPIARLISGIYYTPTADFPGAVTLYMNDGNEVRALIRNFSSKLKEYPQIVSKIDSKTKGIIHMRVATYFSKYGSGGNTSSGKKK